MDISLKVHGLKIPVANIVPSRSIPLSTAVLFECKKRKALKSGMVGMPSTKMTRYRLNNLNIDLFGMSDFIDETDLDRIYLFGAGGNRFKTLPVKIDYGEDGVTTYRYEMDGEYISRIDKFQENELTSILEIFYEE